MARQEDIAALATQVRNTIDRLETQEPSLQSRDAAAAELRDVHAKLQGLAEFGDDEQAPDLGEAVDKQLDADFRAANDIPEAESV